MRGPLGPEALRAHAVRYLQRYAPTVWAFRRVMKRRIDRALREDGGDPEQYAQMLDALVVQLQEAGALDDSRWAEARAEELHRRGTPKRGIAAKMRQKGVSSADVRAALEALEEGQPDPDRSAAWAYARRRRLGPFRRDPEQRRERRERDLAAMGRAGFPWGLARTVIDAEEVPTLDL